MTCLCDTDPDLLAELMFVRCLRCAGLPRILYPAPFGTSHYAQGRGVTSHLFDHEMSTGIIWDSSAQGDASSSPLINSVIDLYQYGLIFYFGL